MADRAPAHGLAGDVHDSSLVFTPFPVQGLRWCSGSFRIVSLALWLTFQPGFRPVLFPVAMRHLGRSRMHPPLTRVNQRELIGFPFTQFKNEKGETPCAVVLSLLVPCNVNVSESSS